ncbi:MAG: ABC transporter ATP-binding protein [Kineosporiaceae bacterium]
MSPTLAPAPAATALDSPATPDVAVTTRGLTKRYGARTVVDALDLDIPLGVVSGFVGPNGAGKTTTIRMLLGLVAPTEGGGHVLGHDLRHPPAYLPQVGSLIEGPTFTPSLSGRDNLRVLAHAGGLPPARVGEVLERVDLAERAKDPFRAYSLGMKQRLGIAAALLPRPRLMVLDEPTNGLDPAGIAQIRELLDGLRADGMTVLVSSHLLAEVEQVADHLVMIRQGTLLFQGRVEELVARQAPHLVVGADTPDDLQLVADIAAALDWPADQDGDGPAALRIEAPAGTDADELARRAAELNRRAHQVGVVLTRLEPRRPTLEDAFFRMTGTASGDVR